MDLSKTCIYCGSTSDLDTSMDVKINDTKYKVSVCKVHEEQASLSEIKKQVQTKLDDFDKLQKAAAALGFTLSPQNQGSGGLIVPTALPPNPISPLSQLAPQQKSLQPPIDPASLPKVEMGGVTMAVQKDERGRSQGQLESFLQAGKGGGGAIITESEAAQANSDPTIIRPSEGDAPRYASHSMQSNVPISDGNGKIIRNIDLRNTTVERTVVAGRAGVPVAIPSKSTSAFGQTTVNVVDTGGDYFLQKRLKGEINANMRARHLGEVPRNFQGEYIHNCMACRGTGNASMGGGLCTKCQGSGMHGQNNK